MEYKKRIERSNKYELLEINEEIFKNMRDVFPYGFSSHPIFLDNNSFSEGKWSVNINTHPHSIGYFLPIAFNDVYIDVKKDSTHILSYSPQDLESAIIPLNIYKGNVCLLGEKAVFIALELLTKKSIKNISLIVKNDIEDLSSILGGQSKEMWEAALKTKRLNIINIDSWEKISQAVKEKVGKVDYLWVDTEDNVGNQITKIKKIYKVLNPKNIDFRGMEIELISKVHNQTNNLTKNNFINIIKDLGFKTSVLNMNKRQIESYIELSYMSVLNIYKSESV